MGKMSLVTTLAVLFGAWLPSQTHPDFSGRWVLESASPTASDVPQALSVRQSLVRTNVRGEPMTPFFKDITIEREVDGLKRSETSDIGVAGGVVRGRVGEGNASGPQQHHSVRWDGNTLILERGSYTGERRETGVWSERREEWSLGADNRLHIVITSRSASEAPSTDAIVYRRAEDRPVLGLARHCVLRGLTSVCSCRRPVRS
jgi:hypothetical protein